ncbi:MAG TPA: choice-of-anchor B family protein [Ignavibacteria bacterium]|nr:choice-of-anchor B family protein [Ignavibacteria bacterium]
MKKFYFLISFLIIGSGVFAQLPNHNTYLIANLNIHPSYSGLWGYVDGEGREYAVLGCSNGTSVVNVTDSANIYEVGFIPGPVSAWREVKTYSHYAYVVSEGTNSRLQIIDLQYLPDSIRLVRTWSYSGYTYTHAISQSGPYLYLSGGNASPNGGVQIVDVTDPVNPVRRGFNSERYVHDCRINNDTIWTCNILNQRVSIINSGDKDNPHEIRNFSTLQGFPHNCAITDDRKYLFVTHENEDPGVLEIYNIEDLEDITYIRSWQPTGITTSVTHNVEIYGNYAILAHYTAGVRILDITDPVNPVESAWYDTRPQDNSTQFEGCWAVYLLPSGKIIASDISNGLFVIRATNLTNFTNIKTNIPEEFNLYQNFPNPFNPVTSLKFDIPKSGIVKLELYDSKGAFVSEILNEFRTAGSYELNYNASALSSGIYFCTMSFSGIRRSIKISLIK